MIGKVRWEKRRRRKRRSTKTTKNNKNNKNKNKPFSHPEKAARKKRKQNRKHFKVSPGSSFHFVLQQFPQSFDTSLRLVQVVHGMSSTGGGGGPWPKYTTDHQQMRRHFRKGIGGSRGSGSGGSSRSGGSGLKGGQQICSCFLHGQHCIVVAGRVLLLWAEENHQKQNRKQE